MNSGMSRPQLESFGRGPALLAIALRQFPKKMWLYKPSLDRWCIHEIILHLANSEASAYASCRQLIVEPGRSPRNSVPGNGLAHSDTFIKVTARPSKSFVICAG